MFTPKVVSNITEMPRVWYIFTMCKTFDEVALFVSQFTTKHGEPSDGYVWKSGDGFIYVYLKMEE